MQVSSALASIGQQMGNLRNEIGATSHGKSLEELKERNSKVDELTREFLIDSTEIIASFLIKTFENENPRLVVESLEKRLIYAKNEDFNEFLDGIHDELVMGDSSYLASEILYNVDYQAYATEFQAFVEGQE